MEHELCIPQELRREFCIGDSRILEIRELNLNDSKEYCTFLGLFVEAYQMIRNEDLSKVIEVNVGNVSIPMFQAEAHLEIYLQAAGKISVAYVDEKMVGFMIYNLAYDCVLIVHQLYMDKEFWKLGLGVKMVESLRKPIKRVIFQTNRELPPTQFLRSTEGRREMIFENEHSITWEMKWEAIQ